MMRVPALISCMGALTLIQLVCPYNYITQTSALAHKNYKALSTEPVTYYLTYLRVKLDLRMLGSRVGWEGQEGVVQGHL